MSSGIRSISMIGGTDDSAVMLNCTGGYNYASIYVRTPATRQYAILPGYPVEITLTAGDESFSWEGEITENDSSVTSYIADLDSLWPLLQALEIAPEAAATVTSDRDGIGAVIALAAEPVAVQEFQAACFPESGG